MARGFIQHIVRDLKRYPTKVFLIENTDRFLYREDIAEILHTYAVHVVSDSKIQQRIAFELREEEDVLILLSQDNSNYLEDITKNATTISFDLKTYFGSYHIPSIQDLDLTLVDSLFNIEQVVSLNRKETLKLIDRIKRTVLPETTPKFNVQAFIEDLESRIDEESIPWPQVCKSISTAIIASIKTAQAEELITALEKINEAFQENIKKSYQQTKNSSSVKKPRIVSKILDYLSFNFKDEKVALIVVDGLAYWQYELIKSKLSIAKSEEVIYSWIPSITQLSRQAIFRGDTPKESYRQGPRSEEKLWKDYWLNKGSNSFEVRYNHEKIDLSNLQSITKFAMVFKDLDEKMHSSTDYKDLLDLTENWLERSDISNIIKMLKEEGFKVFLTTDHGNIQAKGWRGLQGKEKLGTNKSGSRSMRHIEYEEEWLQEEFIANNPELIDSLVMEDQSIYIKDNLSFSTKDSLVTHGGAHLLEVLIPFIEI